MNQETRPLTVEEKRLLAIATGLCSNIPEKDIELQNKDVEAFISMLPKDAQERIYSETRETAYLMRNMSADQKKYMEIEARNKAPMSDVSYATVATMNVPYIRALFDEEDMKKLAKLILEGVRVQKDIAKTYKLSRDLGIRE